MEVGDRVTVLVGSLRLRDGELVGFVDTKAVVWFPAINRTERFATDQLAVLSSSRGRPRRDERARQQRIAGR